MSAAGGVPARSRAAAAAVAALLLLAWQLHLASRVGSLFGDFRAFACAGAAVANGANPYAADALYACERAPMPLHLYHALAGVAVPAPLPGYALAIFVPFGILPYVVACVLWIAVLLASAILCVLGLQRLLNRTFDAATCIVAVSFCVIVIPFGELGSLVMAALIGMALALRARAWSWAAAAGACAMILPHVAAPALLAAFILLPPMRVRVLAALLVLLVLDLAAGGVHTALAYVTTVLPAHAHSEIGSTAQYGLTWILHGAGAGDAAAVAGGEVSYAVMAVLGIVVAWQYYRRSNEVAYVALLPAAFAVIGGTFVHLTQIIIAIVPAILLWDRASARVRPVFAAAALLLMFPWAWVLGQPPLMIVFALFAGYAASSVFAQTPTVSLRIAFGAVVICALILASGFTFGAGVPAHVHGVSTLQQGLAQNAWGDYIRSQRSSSGPAWWIAKAPTWLGLLLLALGSGFVLAKEDFIPAVAVEQVPVTP